MIRSGPKRVTHAARGAGLVGALMLIFASPARAAPPPDESHPPSPPFQAGLTGDWGGLRTRLADRGVAFTGGYVSELAYNARGGARQEATEAGQFDLGVTLDLGRLAGVQGGMFNATSTDRRGETLGQADGLGVLQEVQEIYGRGDAWCLTQFWYEQTLGAARVKIGLIPAALCNDRFRPPALGY